MEKASLCKNFKSAIYFSSIEKMIFCSLLFFFFVSTWLVFACLKVFSVLSSQQFLKEILNELCVYNKRGANQGTYELKPEYKKSAEDTAAE